MHYGRWILGLLAAAMLSGCITPPTPPRLKRNASVTKPDTGPFWWGISSSAFQTEDRGEKPGSPNYFKTDWDLFAEAGRVPPRAMTPRLAGASLTRTWRPSRRSA